MQHILSQRQSFLKAYSVLIAEHGTHNLEDLAERTYTFKRVYFHQDGDSQTFEEIGNIRINKVPAISQFPVPADKQMSCLLL